MKLIIDIDEDLKSAIYNCGLFLSPTDKITLINAINNGTPLPKGHGRLIDADALEKLCYEHEIGNSAIAGIPIIAQSQYDDGEDNIWKPLFDFAPTVIEADKGE